MNDIAGYVEDLARRAKQASRSLGFASDEPVAHRARYGRSAA